MTATAGDGRGPVILLKESIRDGGQPAHEPSDELILEEFEGFESPLEEPIEFANQLAARDYVLEELARWLTSQLGVQAQ